MSHATKSQNIFSEHFTEYSTTCGGGYVRRMRIPLCGEWNPENKIKDITIAIVVHTRTFIAASVTLGSDFTAHKLRTTNSCAKLSDKPAEITEIRHTTFWNNILPLTSHSSRWRHPVGRRCALRMRHGILFQNISYPNSASESRIINHQSLLNN